MRVLLIHPNYHSGGAEIAGNWPPAWVAYLTGYLKAGGYADVHFVDAMTHHLDDEQVRARIEALPDDLRETCRLRGEELDYEDIAARLYVPVGTVRSRLHRARAVLAEELQRRVS